MSSVTIRHFPEGGNSFLFPRICFVMETLTIQTKAAILEKAEQWASRLYGTPVKAYLNLSLSDEHAGRYVVDLSLSGIERWLCMEVQMKHGVIFIPGGAVISGRGSLAEIHRRFS
jgi:hypothetical protein